MTSDAQEERPDEYARGNINRVVNEIDGKGKDPKKKKPTGAAGGEGCCTGCNLF